MICIDSLQISLNRMLLLAVGLWPYQQSNLVQFQLILFLTILTSFIIFQFTAFLTSKCTADLFINVFSSALLYIFFFIKYISFYINIKVVKYLLEQLQNIYNELTDENEISILRKYGGYAERLTALTILLIVLIAPGPTIYVFCPHFFNVLLSLNESRYPLKKRIIVLEYFVDWDKYYYLIMLHGVLALFIGIVVMLAIGIILMVYQLYACGMFRIASYRIEQAMAVGNLRKGNLQNKNLIYKKLIRAVDMHRKAMKFSDLSISRFKIMLSFIIVIGVSCTTLNFFRLFQELSVEYDVAQLILPLTSLTILISCTLIGNFAGQQIIDHNNDVFATAYNIEWYTTSLSVQKMILFLLQRSIKPFNINIAGLIIGSLENAATLISTAISYFTVLRSTRT
ncbi:uncharacterized protein [Anoplolepis gracilipes]|uniref:uncharacterized protein isoform X2 n=1 Tax=Anoplolepis gracilipes TaxID=354296 RepID=UPI003BA2F3B6